MQLYLSCSAVDTCVEARFLSSGQLTAAYTSGLKWPHCLDGTTRPVWVAQRCGSDFNELEYTAMYAVNRVSGEIKVVAGEQCVLLADPARAAWQRQRFGKCGKAPLYASTLPTRICSATSAGVQSCIRSSRTTATVSTTVTAQLTMKTPVRCGAGSFVRFRFTGVSCGPDNAFVQWISATTRTGCVLRASSKPQQQKWNQEVFGSCGVPPGNATASTSSTLCPSSPDAPSSSSPSPVQNPDVSPFPSPAPEDPANPSPETSPENPSSPSPVLPDPTSLLRLPRSPLLAGEEPPSGLTLIGGVTAAGVVNGAGLPVESQVTVGVIDSGIDGTHPDINVVGGKSWVLKDVADAAANEADALIDGYGHGTHVAGIVGAKNNGAGNLMMPMHALPHCCNNCTFQARQHESSDTLTHQRLFTLLLSQAWL